MPRVLHRPDKPLFKSQEAKKEGMELWEKNYSVYLVRHSDNEYLLYRSERPNTRRGAFPWKKAERVRGLCGKNVPEGRTDFYFSILKEKGIRVQK